MDKWRIVGLELEIEQHQLNTITHQDAIQCYIEVFSIWQRKADPPVANICDTRLFFYIGSLPTHPLRHIALCNDIHMK